MMKANQFYRFYPVVGIVEMYQESVELFEHHLPKTFTRGLKEAYKRDKLIMINYINHIYRRLLSTQVLD